MRRAKGIIEPSYPQEPGWIPFQALYLKMCIQESISGPLGWLTNRSQTRHPLQFPKLSNYKLAL